MAGEYGGRGRGGGQSLGSLTGWLCLASSPAGPSAWFVCGGPNGTLPYKRTSLVFCTLLCECLALFSAPPGASQQNALFQTNSRQMQTLHSIMTSGVHSNGISPARELNLRQGRTKGHWHDREKKRNRSCWVVREAQWEGGEVLWRKASGNIWEDFQQRRQHRGTLNCLAPFYFRLDCAGGIGNSRATPESTLSVMWNFVYANDIGQLPYPRIVLFTWLKIYQLSKWHTFSYLLHYLRV